MSPQTPEKNNEHYPVNRTRILLSMMVALWGEVSSALRCVYVNWNEKKIQLYFFYDGEITEEDRESAECIATEMIANFPEHELEIDISRLDFPKPFPANIGELIYLRREPSA